MHLIFAAYICQVPTATDYLQESYTPQTGENLVSEALQGMQCYLGTLFFFFFFRATMSFVTSVVLKLFLESLHTQAKISVLLNILELA